MTENLNIIHAEPATVAKHDWKETEVGSVFVSNYPPYSFWKPDYLPKAFEALNAKPRTDSPLGLYLHIPFCRKRCKFCYFRVYTDKNSSEIQAYLDAVTKEVQLYSALPAIKGRRLKFVYFGGGTPSYISAKHLQEFAKTLKAIIPWDGAEEITFECEPGTLSEPKLQMIREIGVTRLSLGIENFNDAILEENGRAHLSEEIFRVLPWIKALHFDQLNIDLIAGMVGERWETWRETVQKTIDIDPDSVTIYQMELPFNTVYSKSLLDGNNHVPVANWDTKRAWHAYAFEQLAAAGYEISSAYTMVRKNKNCRFVYRDAVWHGIDMMGTGVASFGHISGTHIQNVAGWNEYLDALNAGKLPLSRAFPTTTKERLTREMILQLKMGKIKPEYFARKYDADILKIFSSQFEMLRHEGMLDFTRDEVALTQQGFLRVDQLLPTFYDQKYRNGRYT
ncbi:MAG: coproporphyrinogen III oxidase family protein [candidate division KSB1 bacterium]|nr:coproporphyrinogen III oxidase family protein [candidate division KSB1 bacterium]MDZ7365156.1 coproporphyrinogen III oxidase family protein [candidate division KSB1 bacterium]MDZ7404366.1 coproporphyrinogen III oxidase family protein [candidate division KSB1 bacterium]